MTQMSTSTQQKQTRVCGGQTRARPGGAGWRTQGVGVWGEQRLAVIQAIKAHCIAQGTMFCDKL